MQHLLFYDGECGLCDHLVQFVLKVDKQKAFAFAPLQGQTAKKYLEKLPNEVKTADSLILIENYRSSDSKILIYGKGAFRTLWLVGGIWVLFGWISFLPPCLYNWAYFLVAKNRHRLFSKNYCRLTDFSENSRFLP